MTGADPVPQLRRWRCDPNLANRKAPALSTVVGPRTHRALAGRDVHVPTRRLARVTREDHSFVPRRTARAIVTASGTGRSPRGGPALGGVEIRGFPISKLSPTTGMVPGGGDMRRPASDVCRPSSGPWGLAPGALGPRSRAGLDPTFCAASGASRASGPTCDLRPLCPVSRFLFGREPCLARMRPRSILGGVTGDTFQPPAFCGEPQARVRQGPAQGHTGSTAEAGEQAQGISACAGPTRPLQGTAGTRRAPTALCASRDTGSLFMWRELTACLREQLGFVPSAVARRRQPAGQSRLCPGGPGANGSTLAPAQELRGVEVGPREPRLQGPRFLSQPQRPDGTAKAEVA